MCSSNLQGTQVKETGRKLQARDLSPFLNWGQMFARDHSLGISTLSIYCWKRWANIRHNSVANSFKNLGWSSPGPKAFEGFRPFSNFVTPSLVTTMSSTNGADLSRRGTSLAFSKSDWARPPPCLFFKGGIPWVSFF